MYRRHSEYGQDTLAGLRGQANAPHFWKMGKPTHRCPGWWALKILTALRCRALEQKLCKGKKSTPLLPGWPVRIKQTLLSGCCKQDFCETGFFWTESGAQEQTVLWGYIHFEERMIQRDENVANLQGMLLPPSAPLHWSGRNTGAQPCWDVQPRLPGTRGSAGQHALSWRKGMFHPRDTSHTASDPQRNRSFCWQGKLQWLWPEAGFGNATWRPDNSTLVLQTC